MLNYLVIIALTVRPSCGSASAAFSADTEGRRAHATRRRKRRPVGTRHLLVAGERRAPVPPRSLTIFFN